MSFVYVCYLLKPLKLLIILLYFLLSLNHWLPSPSVISIQDV